MRAVSALLVLAASGACGGDDLPTLGDDVVLASGDFVLRFSRDLETTLLRRGEVLLRFPPDGLQLGLVEEVDDGASYDPWLMASGSPSARIPPGLRWVSVAGAARAADGVTLVFEDGTRARLSLAVRPGPDAEGAFTLVFTPDSDRVAYIRLRPRVEPAQGFYGLGEYFDTPDHRGRVRAMQLELDPEIESANNEAHVPVPFLVGTRGWGLFVESQRPATFDVAAKESDLVEITFGTGAASAEGLPVHLFGAEHPLDVTRLYYGVTGVPRLPARWALGPWIWRDETTGQAQVEDDLQKIRDLDLATTGFWIDRPYATEVNTFDFDPARYVDPDAMLAKAAALGFRVALWHTPYLDEKAAATAELRAEAEAGGFYPPRVGVLLNRWGRPIDFTNPAARAFWQGLIRRYTDRGIAGFKLDYGEDVVPDTLGARNVWRFFDGSDERTMHKEYTRLYHRVYAETLPEEGGFLLCRAGTYGDQVHAPILWPGDLDASFAKHREVVGSGPTAYVAVGGLPASIVAGLSLGPSGFPFYGADTGGYRHSPPDKETFIRWFEQTALSTVMQVGNSASTVPWDFDAETLDLYRAYARLHLRLWPYLWTYAEAVPRDGRPIQRALGLAFPELEAHPPDTYLLGDALLVAPVVERGAVQREVLLPPGRWFDWWTGAVHTGPGTIVVDAPLGVLPLFLREGGIVPLLRPTIDTLVPATDPAVDSYASTPGVLYARVAPGPASSFRLFDGAEIAQSSTEATFALTVSDGTEFRHGTRIEVVAFGPRPWAVTLDGAPLAEVTSPDDLDGAVSGWAHAGTTLHLRIPSGAHTVAAMR